MRSVLLFFSLALIPGVRIMSAQSANESVAASERTLPSDVYPESLSRVPVVRREEMDDDGKRVYDILMGPQTRTLAGLQGPYGIWLHSPLLAEKLLAASQHLRYQTDLGRRLTELATLVVARELDQQFEWTAHEPAALRDGLEQEIIDIVKHRREPVGLGEKETTIIRMGRELFQQKKVSSATYAEAVRLFGIKGVVEISALMAHYTMIGMMLNTFDQQLHTGWKPLLPIP
jgi:4-carboxymuconolactone decarboxylase